MAWTTSMVTLLRTLISDSVAPYTYTDERLTEVLVSSSILVLMEIDFDYTYTVDIDAQTISPDPVTGTSEIAFQVLVCRKAAILILTGEFRTASNKAVAFRDGPSSYDAKDIANKKQELLKNAIDEYEKARVAYKTGDGMSGHGIVTPLNIGLYSGVSSTTIGPLQRDSYRIWS